MIRFSLQQRFPNRQRPSVVARREAAALRRLLCGQGLPLSRAIELPPAPVGMQVVRFQETAPAWAGASASSAGCSAPVRVREHAMSSAAALDMSARAVALPHDVPWADVPDWLQTALHGAWDYLRRTPRYAMPVQRAAAAVAMRVDSPQAWIEAIGLRHAVLVNLPHILNNAASAVAYWLETVEDGWIDGEEPEPAVSQEAVQSSVDKLRALFDLFQHDRVLYAEALPVVLQRRSAFFLQILGLIDVACATDGVYAAQWHAAIESAFAHHTARQLLWGWADAEFAPMGARGDEDLRRAAALLMACYAAAIPEEGRLQDWFEAARIGPQKIETLCAAIEQCGGAGERASVLPAMRRVAVTLRAKYATAGNGADDEDE
ncbi:MAG: hypothetical protein HY696_04710 [Deltaproteobacteria bacterium]|nr:hypothetical protein [Deltaproteobacteria bacterium]